MPKPIFTMLVKEHGNAALVQKEAEQLGYIFNAEATAITLTDHVVIEEMRLQGLVSHG